MTRPTKHSWGWRKQHLSPGAGSSFKKLARIARRAPHLFKGVQYQPDPHPKYRNAKASSL